MKPALIDTDILSLFFRGDTRVLAHFDAYTTVHDRVNFSIITYYEIVSGLKHRDAQRQLSQFFNFCTQNNILPLTEQSVVHSADLYAGLRAQGTPVDDIDLLIAGVALANGLTLVTHNRRHFDRIAELELEDWAKDV